MVLGVGVRGVLVLGCVGATVINTSSRCMLHGVEGDVEKPRELRGRWAETLPIKPARTHQPSSGCKGWGGVKVEGTSMVVMLR